MPRTSLVARFETSVFFPYPPMEEAGLLALKSWQTFYEIVGSAAAALTGLQFVVMAVLVQSPAPGSMHEVRAFGTPTVVHFCAALLTAATMAAPWRAWPDLALCLTIGGVLGVAYSLRTLFHARRAAYRPDVEDWIWYSVLPLLSYAALLADGWVLWRNVGWALPATAATSVLFLLIGIHNSWDTITYIAVQKRQELDTPKRKN